MVWSCWYFLVTTLQSQDLNTTAQPGYASSFSWEPPPRSQAETAAPRVAAPKQPVLPKRAEHHASHWKLQNIYIYMYMYMCMYMYMYLCMCMCVCIYIYIYNIYIYIFVYLFTRPLFLKRQLFLQGITKTNALASWANGWLGCYSLPSSPAVPNSPSMDQDQLFNIHVLFPLCGSWVLSSFQKLTAAEE